MNLERITSRVRPMPRLATVTGPPSPAGDRTIRRRTSGSMGVSVLVHLALLLWLAMRPPATATGEILTQIAYYDELPAAGAAPAPVAVAPARRAPAGTQPDETHFTRRTTEAEQAPEPQSDFALADRLAARLDALREQRNSNVIAAAEAPAPSRLLAAGPAGPAPSPSGGAAVDLKRGGTASTPLALGRGAPVSSARLDVAAAPSGPKPEASRPVDAPTSSRRLAGALLSGPVADRPVLQHVIPEYPEWAKRDAVEGSVTLRFVVLPDGRIKENVFVQKTAGFEDFDQNAIAAIRAWRFQPLTGGRVGEQWGKITFHYRLRDAG